MASLLITGEESRLQAFAVAAGLVANYIDRRGQTTHWTVMADDLEAVLAAAKGVRLTVQRIHVVGTANPRHHDLGGGALVVVSDSIETYELLHQGDAPAWRPKGGEA